MKFNKNLYDNLYGTMGETSKEVAELLETEHGHDMSLISYVVLLLFYGMVLKAGRVMAFTNSDAIEYNRNVKDAYDLFFMCFE